jgi:hypothetical protein
MYIKMYISSTIDFQSIAIDNSIYRGLDRIQGMGSFCDFLRRPNGLGEAGYGILLIAN